MTKKKRAEPPVTTHFNMDIRSKVEIDEIAYQLSEDEAMQMIIQCDAAQEEWEFTERVYAHFLKLHNDYLKILEEDKDD